MKQIFIISSLFAALYTPVYAAELVHDDVEVMKARVVEVQQKIDVSSVSYQLLRVEIRDGSKKGSVVEIENHLQPVKIGDSIYINHTVTINGNEFYSFLEPDRTLALYFFVGVFALLVAIIGGVQGIRGLISLAGSIAIIFYSLLPAVLHGYPPVPVAMGITSLILVLVSYVTHGFNKTTTSAVFGMVATIVLTGGLAYAAVTAAKLSGLATEEATYLRFNPGMQLNFSGLLLAGILIGLLGVLYDAAISQAVTVEELYSAAPDMSRRDVFTKAFRIGREHIGALVNSIIIAYAGASLPLLLLFYLSQYSTTFILNRELFATEIIRNSIAGSGLVLAVPITTLFSVIMLSKKR